MDRRPRLISEFKVGATGLEPATPCSQINVGRSELWCRYRPFSNNLFTSGDLFHDQLARSCVYSEAPSFASRKTLPQPMEASSPPCAPQFCRRMRGSRPVLLGNRLRGSGESTLLTTSRQITLGCARALPHAAAIQPATSRQLSLPPTLAEVQRSWPTVQTTFAFFRFRLSAPSQRAWTAPPPPAPGGIDPAPRFIRHRGTDSVRRLAADTNACVYSLRLLLVLLTHCERAHRRSHPSRGRSIDIRQTRSRPFEATRCRLLDPRRRLRHDRHWHIRCPHRAALVVGPETGGLSGDR
jgi:hypothetical protein